MLKSSLTHRCTLRLTTSAAVDDLGEPTTYTDTDTSNVPCLFYAQSGGTFNPEAGEYVRSTAKLALQKSGVTEAYRVIGTRGFSGVWLIQKVNAKYYSTGKVDHYELDLVEMSAGYSAIGTAAGGVIGPRSSTDNAIARWDGTSGRLLQDSNVTVSDSGSINIPNGQYYRLNNVRLHPHDVLAPSLFVTAVDPAVQANEGDLWYDPS